MMHLAVVIIAWFLTVVCILGNGAVILIITRTPTLRSTAGGVFVLSLAVADFGVGLLYFPVTYICENFSCNFYAERIFITFSSFYLYATRFNLFALTVDRYASIEFPLRYTMFITKKRIYLVVVTAWLVAVVVTFSDSIPYIAPEVQVHVGGFLAWIIVHTVVFSLIPSIILFVTTARLMLVVKRLRRQTSAIIAQLSFNKMSCDVTVNRRSREFDYAKVVVVLVSIFVAVFLTEMTANICLLFKISLCNSDHFDSGIYILNLINSSANPFVYVLLKKDIRSEFRKVLLHRRSTVAPQASTNVSYLQG